MWERLKSWFTGSSAPSQDTPPELLKIREQMEFYLSPSNVEHQSYMKALISARPDRFCPISQFLTFNRVKDMGWTEAEIADACETSRELELDSTRTLVRTVVPFQPDPRRSFRTIHVEGLDADETLDSLQSYFRSIFGKVLRVDLRYNFRSGNERYFSGEVNVELENEDAAQKVLATGIEYRGQIKAVTLVPQFKQSLRPKRIPQPPVRRDTRSSRKLNPE
jgi:lupus La protein